MSQEAQALLHYASNAANSRVADDSDSAYCLECARRWANFIITGSVQVK